MSLEFCRRRFLDRLTGECDSNDEIHLQVNSGVIEWRFSPYTWSLSEYFPTFFNIKSKVSNSLLSVNSLICTKEISWLSQPLLSYHWYTVSALVGKYETRNYSSEMPKIIRSGVCQNERIVWPKSLCPHLEPNRYIAQSILSADIDLSLIYQYWRICCPMCAELFIFCYIGSI